MKRYDPRAAPTWVASAVSAVARPAARARHPVLGHCSQSGYGGHASHGGHGDQSGLGGHGGPADMPRADDASVLGSLAPTGHSVVEAAIATPEHWQTNAAVMHSAAAAALRLGEAAGRY